MSSHVYDINLINCATLQRNTKLLQSETSVSCSVLQTHVAVGEQLLSCLPGSWCLFSAETVLLSDSLLLVCLSLDGRLDALVLVRSSGHSLARPCVHGGGLAGDPEKQQA